MPESELPGSKLVRRLLLATAVPICVAGLAVELACAAGLVDGEGSLRAGLSLSYEGNLPTWYAAGLLWTAALGLGLCARREAGTDRKHWWGLAGLFWLMSLDEAVELHESLGGAALHGVLYFSWVVPGAVLTALFAWTYWGFWRRLPTPARRGFAWAAALYVGGALGMELPLGAWVEGHGDENLTYALLDFVEESLELAGLGVFLSAIVGHLESAAVDG
ncbi:MAG: hypothetical protein KC431_03790 [Myxococcales bacterium]|nr:hypothetical protein [Myxococcales bacterium]